MQRVCSVVIKISKNSFRDTPERRYRRHRRMYNTYMELKVQNIYSWDIRNMQNDEASLACFENYLNELFRPIRARVAT